MQSGASFSLRIYFSLFSLEHLLNGFLEEINFLNHVVTGSSSKGICLAVEFCEDNPLLFKALHAQREFYSLCLCRFVSSL